MEDQNMSRKTSRRSVLKTTAASIAGLSGVGSAAVTVGRSAEKKEEDDEQQNSFTPSGKNSDLHQKMSEAFRKKGSSGVDSILSESGRGYSHISSSADDISEKSDRFETMDRYIEDDSEISTSTVTIPNTDQISVHVMVNLRNVESSYGSATYAEDAIGVGFNPDHWSSVGEPDIYAEDPHSGGFFSGTLDGDGGGVIGVVDLEADPVVLPNESYVELYAELENLDGVAGTVLGYYEHCEKLTTWTGSGVIDGVEIVTDKLGINIDTGASTLWDFADPHDPEDALKK